GAYLYDREAGSTTALNVSTSGTLSDIRHNSVSAPFAVSDDGRYVVLVSASTDLATSDSNGFGDVYRRDVTAGQTVRVTIGMDGDDANDVSYQADMSADGALVVFSSRASNLVPDDTNLGPYDPVEQRVLKGSDIFLWNAADHSIERISTNLDGSQLAGHSAGASITSSGRFIVFLTVAHIASSGLSGEA